MAIMNLKLSEKAEWRLANFLGSFLMLMLVFNKGFSYIHVWIGKFPLFITEAVLFSLLVLVVYQIVKGGVRFDSTDRPIFLGFVVYIVIGLIAMRGIFGAEGTSLLHLLKKTALFYYSFFGLFIFLLVRRKDAIDRILLWMYFGGCLSVFTEFIFIVFSSPLWWPLYVGVANATAQAYCVFYGLFSSPSSKLKWIFSIFSALGFTLLLFTGMRSVSVALGLCLVVFFGVLIFFRPSKIQINHLARTGVLILLFSAVFLSTVGVPPVISRFSFLKGFTFFLRPSGPKTELASKLKLSLEKPKSEVKKVVPVKVKKSPPVKISKTTVLAKAPSPPVTKEPGVSHKKDPSKKGVEKQKKPDKPETPSFERWFQLLNDKVLSKSGNVTWRAKVWFESVRQCLTSNPLLGVGFAKILIVPSVAPYSDPKRIEQGAQILKSEYDFFGRLTHPTKKPSADITPAFPFAPDKARIGKGVSTYWYDMDPHNSHVAIFYRLGFLGLMAYLWLVFICFHKVWGGLRRNSGKAIIMVLFLIWYMVVAAFNVVLEGPFMGSIFWVFLGLILAYPHRFENNNL